MCLGISRQIGRCLAESEMLWGKVAMSLGSGEEKADFLATKHVFGTTG